MPDDAASCRARPTDFLAQARGLAAESTEPDLELTTIFASARDAAVALCDASSPHRSVRVTRESTQAARAPAQHATCRCRLRLGPARARLRRARPCAHAFSRASHASRAHARRARPLAARAGRVEHPSRPDRLRG